MNPRAAIGNATEDPAAIVWPPERFFWAIVEPASSSPAAAVGWKRDGPIPPGLFADLADQVPVDVDQLHAVAAAEVCGGGDGGSIIICAARRDELEAVHAAGVARRLVPSSLPDEVIYIASSHGEAARTPLDPGRLNLLVGAFEPIASRRARARRHARAAAAVLALSVLALVGLLRRASHDERLAARARGESAAILARLGFDGDAGPATLRLLAELDQRRRLAGVDVARRQDPDAAAALARVLNCWPADTAASPRSLSVGPDGASLSVVVPPPGDAAAFIASLRPVEGWRLDEPRLASVGPNTRVTLRLHPAPAPSRENGGRR